VAVLHARQIAAQQSGAPFNVALRQAALAAIGFDHFSDIDSWLFFGHGYLSSSWGILFTNNESGKTELRVRESNQTTVENCAVAYTAEPQNDIPD
jgi:hypothetical protein